MAGKPKDQPAEESEGGVGGPKPIGIIVRRGALRRFDRLKKKEAELPVAVTWDRRQHERRTESDGSAPERRAGDRRRKPPFTWDLADFVIVPEDEQG